MFTSLKTISTTIFNTEKKNSGMDMGVSLTPPYILSIVNANIVRGHVEAGLKLGQAPTALGGLPALKNKQKKLGIP